MLAYMAMGPFVLLLVPAVPSHTLINCCCSTSTPCILEDKTELQVELAVQTPTLSWWME